MKLSEYVEFDALGLGELVRRREVSAAELAACAFEAMDAVDPSLNAIVTRVSEIDAAPADGPFQGVPFLLKDLGHNFAGIPSTMGSRIGRGLVYSEDGPMAARLRASGLVPVGVTNSSEFGVSAVTEPVAHGPTRNPWDLERSPGGSSGGSAAAVAAGVVPMAHASDGGGSIRMPAAWCGLVGLKPSRGRNPLGGWTTNDAAHWVTAQHVVSRSLCDTAAALDATAGPTPGDYVFTERPATPFLEALNQAPSRLRVAVLERWSDGPPNDEACAGALRRAATLAEALGHEVEEASPEVTYAEMVDLCRDLFLPTLAEGVYATSRATGLAPGPDTLEPMTLAALEAVKTLSATDLKQRLSELAAMCRRLGAFMERYDVLLTPAVSRLPCPIGVYDGLSDDVGFWTDEMANYAFSALASLTGQPALVFPFELSEGGLPVGLQIASRIGDEATLFRLAAQFEAERPWAGWRPGVHAAR